MIHTAPTPIPAIPFWFWNGAPDEALLTAQLESAAAAGLRGFAIHARAGNQIPYLGPRWMELVRHACDESARLGLEVWLYDEEDYPSGTAGRRIQRAEPELRQRTLAWTCGPAGSLTAISEPLAAFRFAEPHLPRQLSELSADEPAILFHIERADRYVDTLDPRSGARFIAATHEAYAAALGARIGSVVTAIYTDDANFHLQDRLGLGWTADLPAEFARRHGYDLIPRLPCLVADLPGCAAVRIDFHRTLQALFLERWVRPQAAWCADRKLAFVGHLRGDEGPLWMSLEQYGSALAYHRELSLPSIDDFLLRARDGRFTKRARTDHGLSPVLLYRQAASIADQCKDGRVSSEILASMGWAGTPAEVHRHLLFQQLLGITDLTHHAFSVSTAGIAKRDHPPSWFTQQAWWAEHGRRICMRQARLSGWVAEGTAEVQVLILWPTVAGWAALRGADRRPAPGLPLSATAPTCDGYETLLAELALALIRAGVSFHFADELTCVDARVARGALHLGRMAYPHLIVPPWPHQPEQVAGLLATAAAAGATVHRWHGSDIPALVKSLPAALGGLGESGDIVVQARRLPNGTRSYILANCGDADLTVTLEPGPGPWAITDLESAACIYRGPLPAPGLVLASNAAWRIAPTEESALATMPQLPGRQRLVLDGWRWEPAPTLVLLDGGFDALGCWWSFRALAAADGDRPSELTIPIDLPAGTRLLGIAGEQLLRCELRLAGTLLPPPSSTLPASADLALIPLEINGPYHGRLTLSTARIAERFEDLRLLISGMVEIESSGAAGWQPRIVPWRDPGVGCDLARRGLPFHWGPLTVSTTSDLVDPTPWEWLDLGPLSATARVSLNGEVIAELDHPPWRVHVAGRLQPGRNTVSITIAGTAHNCFGPHRNPLYDAGVWSPAEGEAKAPANPYHLAPFGLFGSPAWCAANPS